MYLSRLGKSRGPAVLFLQLCVSEVAHAVKTGISFKIVVILQDTSDFIIFSIRNLWAKFDTFCTEIRDIKIAFSTEFTPKFF